MHKILLKLHSDIAILSENEYGLNQLKSNFLLYCDEILYVSTVLDIIFLYIKKESSCTLLEKDFSENELQWIKEELKKLILITKKIFAQDQTEASITFLFVLNRLIKKCDDFYI